MTQDQWPQIPVSTYATATVNPIRKRSEGYLNVNSRKNVIDLLLGDPTLSGVLPPTAETLDAMNHAVYHYKHGYNQAVGSIGAREAVVRMFSNEKASFKADDVVLSAGASHSLQMVFEAIGGVGDNVLLPKPGFPLYQTILTPLGVEIREYNLQIETDGLVDLEHLESLIDEKTRAIVVNNPSNPTGIVFPKQHLQALLTIAYRYRIPIIADEVYGDLTFNGAEFISMAELEPKIPLIRVDSLSKRWMVPGWRMGWTIVYNRYGALDKFREALQPLTQRIQGPCGLIQFALPRILANTKSDYLDTAKYIMMRNAKIVMDMLTTMPGLKPLKPSGGMYLIVQVSTHLYGDDETFSNTLQTEQSVLILPGSTFGCPGCIRVVLAASEEKMLDAALRIREFCRSRVLPAKNLPQICAVPEPSLVPRRKRSLSFMM